MASKPEGEEASVHEDRFDIGWAYDMEQKKHFPRQNAKNVKSKMCPPKYKFEIREKGFLDHAVKRSEDFPGAAWMEDYKRMKTGHVILLEGSKIIEKEGDIAAHRQEHIVSSVHFRYHVDLLINFSDKLKNRLLSDLKQYLYSMVEGNNESFIPNELGKKYLSVYIYPPGKVRKRLKSIKHALQEFCRLVKDSKVSENPYSATLITPVSFLSKESTYASVVKNSKTKTQTNSLSANERKFSCNKNIQALNDNKSLSGNAKKFASAVDFKWFGRGRNYNISKKVAKIHKRLSTKAVHKADLSKSHVPVTNRIQLSNAKYRGTSLGKARKGEKSCEENNGNNFVRGSKGGDHSPTNTAQIQKKSSNGYAVKDQMFVQAAPHGYPLLSVNVTASNTSKAFHEGKNDIICCQNLSEGNSLHSAKALDYQASLGSDNFTFERGKFNYDAGGDAGILLDKSLANRDETLSDPITFHQSSSGDGAGMSCVYSTSHSTKQVHNSDSQTESGLTPKETYSAESVKTEAKGSVDSNMYKAKSQRYIESTNEDKEDFSIASDCLKPTEEVFDECGMTRKYYGVRSELKQKTIILLGASGSGKTTLVNFVANYYCGVKTADGELVHVVRNSNDVRSYTASITAYTFCADEHDTPITVIDTPGLNDSSGAEVRDHVQSLKTFLANAASQNFEIHAIGFVAQAHLVRVTSSERLVMDYVSTLFGQSIENHFFTFVTFADNQETPPVVEAMKNYGVKCNTFLKFNNSALSNNKTDEIDDLDRVYWRIGNKSWKKCMKSLHNLSALSVDTMKTLTNEVFASTVIESAERELRAELKVFISYFKESKYLTKDSVHSCEKVWELASVARHLRSTQASESFDTECILVNLAEIVCKEIGVHHNSCIQLLSLAPSRHLLNAGIGVIQSIEPLYWHAVGISNKRRGTFLKSIPKYLYCHQCEADHCVEKINPYNNIWVPIFGINTMYNTYRCLICKCDGNVHGQSPNVEHSSESSQSYTLDLNQLLEHTRNCLANVMEEFSIPGYLTNLYIYLHHINDTTNHKSDQFIKALQIIQK